WISYSPNSGTTDTEIDEIKVTVDRLGLSPGNYTGNITVSSDGGNQNIVVSMTVPDEPLLLISPKTLDFGDTLTTLTFDVANAGTGDLNWSISDNQEWITTSPTAGTNYGTVNVTVSRDGISPGDYSGTVTVSSNGGTEYVEVYMNMPADEPPTAVTLAEPMNNTSNSIDITWSRNYDNDFAAYQLYYDTTPAVTENSTLVTTITDNNQNSFTVTGLSANTTYYFKVYVMDTAQQTTGSNVVSGTTSTVIGNWSLVTNISGLTFKSVWFNSENDGYAVGYSGSYASTSGSGRIYHTGGSTWLPETIPSSYGLHDVRFIDTNNGYAVGEYGTFLYFNGISWSEFNSPTSSTIGSVFPLTNDDIWCYANDDIYQWNGSEWSEYNLAISTITDIFFIDINNGWVVDRNGKMFHYNGVGWAFHSDLNDNYIERFFFLNSSEGWYFYSSYSSTSSSNNGAYHFDGSSWTLYENSDYPIYKVRQLQEISSSNVWAVGYDGVIFNYDGTRWNKVICPVTDDLYGIFMLSGSDGWAVGENGVILRYH
ncbi:MAG: fibronectin type III domain-containing protein, partial [Candidatus Marinimicrobia bacterium]|nr:fibronectin type III domain-containing protein [Candidatus Neomarinimicrobiota bacterium]